MFMFTIYDRQMIYAYFKAYAFCLISLMGLFVVVDLFLNLDDLMSHQKNTGDFLRFVGVLYGYKSFQIFDRLCEAIVLLAGMFTVAWMQRNNELVPLLSAGVSTRRAVQPVLLCAFVMMGLVAINQEFALPKIDIFMVENKGNWDGAKEAEVKGDYDMRGIHISGRTAIKKEGLLYVGTDDGLIQVTANDGLSWTKSDTFAPVPEMTFVSDIEASHHDANVVYASFDGHKNADFKPWVMKSADRGKSWTNISGDLPERGTVYCLAEDPGDPNLLFAVMRVESVYNPRIVSYDRKLTVVKTVSPSATFGLRLDFRTTTCSGSSLGRVRSIGNFNRGRAGCKAIELMLEVQLLIFE